MDGQAWYPIFQLLMSLFIYAMPEVSVALELLKCCTDIVTKSSPTETWVDSSIHLRQKC